MNSVILIGRLTKDPSVDKTANGTSVCKFTLAVDGNNKDETDFLDVTVFNKSADNLALYKHKGDMIAFKGRLKKDTWQDQAGQNKSKTYVIAEQIMFLSSAQKKEEDPTTKEWAKDDLPF